MPTKDALIAFILANPAKLTKAQKSSIQNRDSGYSKSKLHAMNKAALSAYAAKAGLRQKGKGVLRGGTDELIINITDDPVASFRSVDAYYNSVAKKELVELTPDNSYITNLINNVTGNSRYDADPSKWNGILYSAFKLLIGKYYNDSTAIQNVLSKLLPDAKIKDSVPTIQSWIDNEADFRKTSLVHTPDDEDDSAQSPTNYPDNDDDDYYSYWKKDYPRPLSDENKKYENPAWHS